MSDHPALDTLRRAVNAYRLGQGREALALAEAAYRMATEIPGAPPQIGAVHSFYGFMVGTVGRRPTEGLAICRDAIAKHFWEARVYEHLARLEMALGDRKNGIATLERGLTLSPEDRELLAYRKSVGVRRAPTFRFLDRNHPLNRWFGLWRARAQTPEKS